MCIRDSDEPAHPVRHRSQREQSVRRLPGSHGDRGRCEPDRRPARRVVRRRCMGRPVVLQQPDLHRGRRIVPGSRRAVTGMARRRTPCWLREPLLHFIVLGGALFGLDHFLVGSAHDAHTIVVGADVDSEARETFKAARGREPDPEELAALHRVWLDNEVLYREGLALQVDKGDPAIRERVIFKALSVIDSNVHLPTTDDKVLRAWFDSHRDKYDEPARYDFEEAALSGDSSEAAVREFVTALNSGVPGDAKAGLR